MTEPLSAEREHEIRALDFLDLIRDNDEHTAARAALSVVCTLLNEIDRLRVGLTAAEALAAGYGARIVAASMAAAPLSTPGAAL